MTQAHPNRELVNEDQEQGIADAWRPIHYLGSKLRFVREIASIASTMLPSCSKACDLFAGSGTVASFLAEYYQVTAVDIQEYSRVICSALLETTPNQRENAEVLLSQNSLDDIVEGIGVATRPLVEVEKLAYAEANEGRLDLLCDIIEHGALITLIDGTPNDERLKAAMSRSVSNLQEAGLWASNATTAFRYFGGVYFSYQHAIDIDKFRSLAEICDPQFRDTYIAASLSTASELVNTVGKHFAQPLRPRNKEGRIKENLLNIVGRDRFNDSQRIFLKALDRFSDRNFRSINQSRAVRADFSDFLGTASLEDTFVYADPPYTRDHYSRFYHVLETLALRDSPEISTNFAHGVTSISRGLYRKERHQSPFCIMSQAPNAFEKMFANIAAAGAPLILSYSPFENAVDNHPRVVSLDLISELAAKHFQQVEVLSAGTFSHSRLNRTELHKERSDQAEKFVVCRL